MLSMNKKKLGLYPFMSADNISRRTYKSERKLRKAFEAIIKVTGYHYRRCSALRQASHFTIFTVRCIR